MHVLDCIFIKRLAAAVYEVNLSMDCSSTTKQCFMTAISLYDTADVNATVAPSVHVGYVH